MKGLYCKELFTLVKWDTRLAKSYFEATSVGSSLLNFTKVKLNLLHSTQHLVFIQVSTDYARKILEVVGDNFFNMHWVGRRYG